jgi:CheY-like chemotaxis protein
MKTGPIILIDDDEDDKDVFVDILKDLEINNQVLWFENCENAFSFLLNSSEQPFIIFCDLNLPGLNGTECKQQIDDNEELRKRSIPFVFFSTSVNQKTVDDAYTKMTVQGFFQKKNSYDELKSTIKLIADYWSECRHPNALH